MNNCPFFNSQSPLLEYMDKCCTFLDAINIVFRMTLVKRSHDVRTYYKRLYVREVTEVVYLCCGGRRKYNSFEIITKKPERKEKDKEKLQTRMCLAF